MSKLTLETVQSGYYSTTLLNENFKRIEGWVEMLVSRYGHCPNHMEADLDMNNFDILNVGTLKANRVIVTGDLNVPNFGYEELVERRSSWEVLTECKTLFNTPDYYMGNGSIAVYVDGLKQIKDHDYTEISSTQLLFNNPVPAGSVVEMIAGLTLFATEEMMANRKVITLGRDSSYNAIAGGAFTLAKFNKVLRDDTCTLSDGERSSIVVPAGYRYAKVIGAVQVFTYVLPAASAPLFRPVGIQYFVFADNFTQAELGATWTNYAAVNGISSDPDPDIAAPGGILGAYGSNVVTPFMPVNPGDELGVGFWYRHVTNKENADPGLQIQTTGTFISVELMP
jgi:hypothetical protein